MKKYLLASQFLDIKSSSAPNMTKLEGILAQQWGVIGVFSIKNTKFVKILTKYMSYM